MKISLNFISINKKIIKNINFIFLTDIFLYYKHSL